MPESQTGSLVVRVFTSRAQFPVANATVIISQRGDDKRHHVYSIQSTDESGATKPFVLDAPNADLSQTPGGASPFSNYALVVEHPEYYLATFGDLQVFPGVETVQNVALNPLPRPAVPDSDASEPVVVTPQPL